MIVLDDALAIFDWFRRRRTCSFSFDVLMIIPTLVVVNVVRVTVNLLQVVHRYAYEYYL